jgi:myo-inositol 2-dehydrogenase / D-chiro-inositol 1-dehydrogenase
LKQHPSATSTQEITMTDPTRRDFLKQTSAAAVSAGVLGAINSRAYAADDDTIRIGVVGCGGRGRGAVTQALKTYGNTKLVAIGDAFREQIDNNLKFVENAIRDDNTASVEIDEDHKFVGFDAFQKVIDSDIDVIVLATPPGFRPAMFEYAVNAGKNIFFEKPVATDAPGIRRVLAAARKAQEKNLKVGVGLQRHHQNAYVDLVQRVHDGEIGDLTSLRVYWNGGGVWGPGDDYHLVREQCRTEMEYQVRNWYYYAWLCGDHICEQHIHNLDVGNWLKQGYPVKARGMGGRQVRIDKKYGQIFDHFAVQYDYDDGSTMFSECRHIPNCWNSVTEHGQGTKGRVSLSSDAKARTCFIEKTDGTRYAYRGDGNDPYQTEHDHLFAAIRQDLPYMEAEYGAMSTMTAILGRMVTYSGKEISMEEAMNRGRRLMPDDVAALTFDSTPPVLPNDKGEYPVPVPGVTEVLG